MDGFLVLLGLGILALPVVAVTALVLSIGSRKHLRMLDQRFDALERRLAGAAPQTPPAAALAPEPPPATSAPEPDIHPEVVPPSEPEPQPTAAVEPAPDETASSIPAPAPAPQPAATPAAPAMSFEERLGTQWAVWVGGIALALGGIFLVRYSIEAGLLGPGVRVVLGALLAARAHRRRRMGAPHRTARRHLRAAERAHPEHPHRRRHRRRLCGCLCRLRAL